MKKIAFIPARGGSKSIPLKNIKLFCEKPLIYWNLISLQNSMVDEIIVATDSNIIKDTVLGFSFSKVRVYSRTEENAQDTSSTESVMLEYINNGHLALDDIFILVQATSPFTQSIDFNNGINLFLQDKADSLLTATLSKRFFWNLENKPINYNYKARPRRQDFNGLYMENGAFYVSTVKNIVESGNRLSGKISIYEMPEHTSLELDEGFDWLLGEQIMYNILQKDSKYESN